MKLFTFVQVYTLNMFDLYQFSVSNSNALKYSKHQIYDFSLFQNHKTTWGYARPSKNFKKVREEKSVGNTALQVRFAVVFF